MKILITGGAGFVGSHLCDRFIGGNCDVTCVDNMSTGTITNLIKLVDNKKFHLIQRDVSEELGVDEDFDFVLHFASPASPVDYLNHPIDTLRVGSLGTINCLELARKCGASFLLASTSEVYGDPKQSPQVESYWGNVNPVGPRSVYDESKRFAEAITMAYKRKHNVNTRIIRIFNTYGPRMRAGDGRVVPNFIKQALAGDNITVYGDGSQTRSFCYVSDLVDAVCCMLDINHSMPINLGNQDEITIYNLAREIINLTDSKSNIIYEELPVDDPKIRRPDISMAKRLLKWEPVVDRAEGLGRTIEYFKKQGLC